MTQNAKILKYLQRGHALTPLTALRMFGTLRLSGRIYDLKRDGHKIERVIVRRRGKNFASYTLAA